MSITYAGRPSASPGSLGKPPWRLPQFLSISLIWLGRRTRRTLGLVGRAIAVSRMRRTVRELERLDDRTLRDIGLSRWELHEAMRPTRPIERISLGPHWGSWSAGTRLGSHN